MSDQEHDSIPVELFDVQAFREDGTRDERAEQIAHPRGFIPGEKERAESVAKRCNALNLAGVKFEIVPASPQEPAS
jgi:hypothetical protein